MKSGELMNRLIVVTEPSLSGTHPVTSGATPAPRAQTRAALRAPVAARRRSQHVVIGRMNWRGVLGSLVRWTLANSSRQGPRTKVEGRVWRFSYDARSPACDP